VAPIRRLQWHAILTHAILKAFDTRPGRGAGRPSILWRSDPSVRRRKHRLEEARRRNDYRLGFAGHSYTTRRDYDRWT